MEYENKYASNGKGNAALTLGIIGSSLGALGNNVLGNVLGGGNCNCSDNTAVNRYELGLQNTVTEKDMEIAYLRSRDASKTDDLELYKYLDGRFRGIESQICQQNVVNAQVTANLSCMQNAINGLQALTRTIIPIDNICPQPMAQYNSWTAPTTTTTAGA